MTMKVLVRSVPAGWPMDGRSRVRENDHGIFITHPDRKKQKYDPETNKWSEVTA